MIGASEPATVEFGDPDEPGRVWRFERGFFESNWTCIWGRGCVGILDSPTEHLGHGCCSVGAELLDDDEARLIGALAASIDPDRFEHHAVLDEAVVDQAVVDEAVSDGGGVFADELSPGGARLTRIVDGACVFLNRPGFSGGAGCALHLAALAEGEEPLDWKPSVCWQLPIKVDHETDARGAHVSVVRRWSRSDWGDGGESMAWLCTDPDEKAADAFVGETRVIDALEPELTALLGRSVFVELSSRLSA